jgi:type II secretory pathway component HofQ
MRQRVSVDLEKTPFADALKQISRQTGANLILDTRVEKDAAAKVSLQMEDVPLETAVRLLAEMAGLKPVRVGNVLFVTGKANANEMRNDPDVAQPNQNLINQQQQLLQLQLGGGVPINFPVAAPPGVAPAVPPGVIQDPREKDEKAP